MSGLQTKNILAIFRQKGILKAQSQTNQTKHQTSHDLNIIKPYTKQTNQNENAKHNKSLEGSPPYGGPR